MAANVELGMQGPGALRRPLNKVLMVQLRPGTARTARRRARPAARSRRSSASSSRTRQCSAASISRPACSWAARSTPASVRCVACLALSPFAICQSLRLALVPFVGVRPSLLLGNTRDRSLGCSAKQHQTSAITSRCSG